MAVKLVKGLDEHTISRANKTDIVGQSLRSVFNDAQLREFFNIDGRESIQVQSVGSGTFRAENSDYVLRDGDVVRLSTPAGEKGR